MISGAFLPFVNIFDKIHDSSAFSIIQLNIYTLVYTKTLCLNFRGVSARCERF